MWPSEEEVTFEPGREDLIYLTDADFAPLNDPAKGYLMNDKIVMEARLSIRSPFAPNRCAPFPSIYNSEVNFEKRVQLRDVTLVLPHWEAVHATGGGQRGAELRDDYYGGVSPQSKAADWVGSTIGKFNP